jgi:hypothetical protein
VNFCPGGPLIRRSWFAIARPLFDFAAIAARMHVAAASNSFFYFVLSVLFGFFVS